MCRGYASGTLAKLECIPDIKIKLINKVKGEIAPTKGKTQEILENSVPDGEPEWFIASMVVDEKGKIKLPRDYCDWYGNDEFALWLKEFVEEGTMEFTSEDGKEWGYWFDGKGNVHALRYPERLPEKQELYN